MVAKFQGLIGKIAVPNRHLSHWYSNTQWTIATSMHALTAAMIPRHRVKKTDNNAKVYEAYLYTCVPVLGANQSALGLV